MEKTAGVSLKSLLVCYLGTLLAGFGMAEVFAKTNLMPAQWQFENYGWFMVVVGYLLMIPFVVSRFKKIQVTNNKEG